MVSHERGRGKVLVFAHNSHLQRGKAQWQLGTDLLTWWPVGSHLNEIFGPRYAIIGSAVGVSDANGIGQPETGTLEEQFTLKDKNKMTTILDRIVFLANGDSYAAAPLIINISKVLNLTINVAAMSFTAYMLAFGCLP